MVKNARAMKDISQHSSLPIRIVSQDFGHLSADDAAKYKPSTRLRYYFFILVLEGQIHYEVDTEKVEVSQNELLFMLPHQVQKLPETKHGVNYFKLGFDEECLVRLPKQYAFLLNPLNLPKIRFSPQSVMRLKAIFEILVSLLSTPKAEAQLVLAYLNSLLSEIDVAYFATEERPSNDRISKFIGFKLFVENNLTDHPSISHIAEALALSSGRLYDIVKQYSGLSPKEFITSRLILEARRRIYHGEATSVKELAFELGFNDPDYFSRRFKKATGKTVKDFFRDLS